MNLARAKVLAALRKQRGRVESFERGFNSADNASPNAITMTPGYGDQFVDQFTVTILTYYFTVSGGVYTKIAATALATVLKTQVAAFIFGYADFAAGFAKAQSLLPLTGGWAYEAPQFYKGAGSISTTFGTIDSNVTPYLQRGDVVQPITATTAGPINTAAFVVMRLSNGYYSNLLNSLSSDVFSINKCRYQFDSSTISLTQFDNPVQLINQSLFGAAKTDNIDPTAYKQPQQYQAGIIDLNVNQTFFKPVGWATYVNYDAVRFSLSFFVSNTQRLK